MLPKWRRRLLLRQMIFILCLICGSYLLIKIFGILIKAGLFDLLLKFFWPLLFILLGFFIWMYIIFY